MTVEIYIYLFFIASSSLLGMFALALPPLEISLIEPPYRGVRKPTPGHNRHASTGSTALQNERARKAIKPGKGRRSSTGSTKLSTETEPRIKRLLEVSLPSTTETSREPSRNSSPRSSGEKIIFPLPSPRKGVRIRRELEDVGKPIGLREKVNSFIEGTSLFHSESSDDWDLNNISLPSTQESTPASSNKSTPTSKIGLPRFFTSSQLIVPDPTTDVVGQEKCWTAISRHINARDLSQLQKDLAAGACPNQVIGRFDASKYKRATRNSAGMRPVHQLASIPDLSGDFRYAKLLHEYRADLNAQVSLERPSHTVLTSAIQIAIETRKGVLVRELLSLKVQKDKPVEVSVTIGSGERSLLLRFTPLHYCLLTNRETTANALYSYGASLRKRIRLFEVTSGCCGRCLQPADPKGLAHHFGQYAVLLEHVGKSARRLVAEQQERYRGESKQREGKKKVP